MVSIRVISDDLKALADPARMDRAQLAIIDRGLGIFRPLAQTEAPARTGRGRAMIAAHSFHVRGGQRQGVVSPGKAFWLRILETGAKWREDIVPFRYDYKRRGSQRSARLARQALGPAGMRGNLRALRFRLGGVFLFRSRVVHPDLPPNKWLERAARKGESPFAQAAESVLETELNRSLRSRVA